MKLRMVFLALIVASFAQAYVSPLPKEFVETHRSNFGASGSDYIPGYWHCGDDIFCPLGTKVFSPVDGKIIGGSPSGWDSFPNDVGGKRKNFAMKIAFTDPSGNQQMVVLGHLLRPCIGENPLTDSQVQTFRSGEYVRQGEFLGTIGYWSRGIHLHIAVTDAYPFPSSGYGIQKLPRPTEKFVSGVRSFGCWRDPLPWLKKVTLETIGDGIDRYLPVARENDTLFIQQDGDRQLVMLSDQNFQASASICTLPNGEKAVDISTARDIVLVITKNEDEHALWLVVPGNEPRRVVLSTEELFLARWRTEVSYLPIRISGTWKALDLDNFSIREPADVLPIVGSLAWDLTGPQRENSCTRPYLARSVVWPDKQSTGELYRDRQVSFGSMWILPLQPDRHWCNEETKDVVYLSKDMSGCTIWRSILSARPGLLGGMLSMDIPHFDTNWTKLIYKTTNEIFSCSVVGKDSPKPEILFDEMVNGRFVIRKVDLSGRNLMTLTN